MKRIGILLSALALTFSPICAKENIREQFKNNEAIIYTLNIRNFAAVDKNFDGLINEKQGDIQGNFTNAKPKLKELSNLGINTVYLLPITPTGKLKALGNAGSLYAMDDFSTINPQLEDYTNNLTLFEEAKEFIDEAHKLNMNVIIDLPSCASYDLTLKKPDWFIYKNNEPIVPADWTDVRLFKIYNKDKTLYKPTLDNFKSFVDMAQAIGFDGIRADVAAIKPYEFWKEIIDYSRNKNPDFLFLAEAAIDWTNPAPIGVPHYATVQELLNAGFDSYYGSWSDFKNVKSKKEFDEKIEKNIALLKKNKNSSIMSSFATHDQQAPILRGLNYWNMILWLNVTLPVNSYFLDGYPTGDDFTYDYENKKAEYSLTDDEFYYVHSGIFDIFNLNAPPIGKYPKLKQEVSKAIAFKKQHKDMFKINSFKTLKTNNDKIFAYSVTHNNKQIIAIGSLDESNTQKTQIKSSQLKKEYVFSVINAKKHPTIEKNKINTILEPLELQVYLIQTN